MRRIDLHTHAFNVRYIPIAGVLHQVYRVPKVIAHVIAKLLNWTTGDQIEPTRGNTLTGRDAALLRTEADPDPAHALAAITPPELIDDPDVREALAMIGSGSHRALVDVTTRTFTADEAREQFERLYRQVAQSGHRGMFRTALQMLAWIRFLTHSEQFLVGRLKQTYGKDVDLFVHHMMDMEHYYDPSHCHYDFVGEQLPRMKRLVAANPELLNFVAWSPRRPNAIHVIKRAIDDGAAAGVKVYPASGYRPDDAINDDLYEFCAAEKVPIFAHCNTVGMEARKGYGEMSNPKYWSAVLNRPDVGWQELRLCLGHAGEGAPWFGKPSKPLAIEFVDNAVALAVDPKTPNVFLEFGFHDELLDDKLRKNFAKILSDRINATPDRRLGDRIVYGTDWHMIQRLPKHEKYFELFREIFSKPPLDIYAERFFYTNGVRFLNIRAHTARLGRDHPARAHLERVAKRAEAVERRNIQSTRKGRKS